MFQRVCKIAARSVAVGILIGLLVAAASAESFETSNSPPDNHSASQPPAVKTPVKAPPVLLTPEREAAALQFVREHHPELVDLLKGLKPSHPKQYQTAVTQLYQTSERLARIHETDPQRYEIELKLWKIKSRIQLLSARASLSGDTEFESELKAALAEQAQVQLQEMQMDRDRVAERLKNIDRMVDKFQANEQTTIDKQFKMLVREIDRQRALAAKQLAAARLAGSKNAKQSNHTKTTDSAKSTESSDGHSSHSDSVAPTNKSNSANSPATPVKSNTPTNKPAVPPTAVNSND